MDKMMNYQPKLDLHPKGMGVETVSVILPSLEYSERSGRNKVRETMSTQDDGKPRKSVLLGPAEPGGKPYAHPPLYGPESTRFCQTSHWKAGGRFPGDDLTGAGERAKEDFWRLTHSPCL